MQYGRNIRSPSNSPDRFYPRKQTMTKQAKTFKEKMRQQLLKAGQLLGDKVLASGYVGRFDNCITDIMYLSSRFSVIKKLPSFYKALDKIKM